jgi:hypothetical protein
MNNSSIHVLKRKGAASLWVPLLLIGAAAPLLARGAPPAGRPVLIADIDLSIILEAPPPPRHEVIIERDRPSRDHVWINGYWMNNHGRREWLAGHWERPPQGRTLWVEPRWEKRGRGYAFVEGYWAEAKHDNRHDDRRDDHR